MGESRRRQRRGFTLVELMIVVAIMGVLAVLAMTGVRKYVANAKTAEARAVIGRLGQMAISAYETERGTTTTLALGGTGTHSSQLCSSSTQVPTTIPKGSKYQPTVLDWTQGDMITGWQCLKFSVEQPQYYMIQYVSAGGQADNTPFYSYAWGDLNGDGITSTFMLAGGVTQGNARISPTMFETNPEE